MSSLQEGNHRTESRPGNPPPPNWDQLVQTAPEESRNVWWIKAAVGGWRCFQPSSSLEKKQNKPDWWSPSLGRLDASLAPLK